MKLLGTQNAKTNKGESLGYLTGIMYLAPSTMVKGINICPMSSEGCKKACLFSAGRGRFSNVKSARIKKTELFRDDKKLFFEYLIKDIKRVERKAIREGLKPCIRLNGTSDISWENYKLQDDKNIFELFPHIQFYDYTKNYTRFKKQLPSNYHLTYSRVENDQNAKKIIKNGHNVAVVFKDMPSKFANYQVINGDKHDLRFLDASQVVVGLTAKGEAKKDLTGFVL